MAGDGPREVKFQGTCEVKEGLRDQGGSRVKGG